MPNIFLDRIPFPNLKVYSFVSLMLFGGCVYHAANVTSNPFWRYDSNWTAADSLASQLSANGIHELFESAFNWDSAFSESIRNTFSLSHNKVPPPYLPDELRKMYSDTRTMSNKIKDVLFFMAQEPVCIWIFINMAFCCLVLLGKMIQRLVFGELRISEYHNLKDKFWNFVFYKFIFVFGVVNVQFMHEVVLWVSWFAILGFLLLISQLCKERSEYLSSSPTTPGWAHIRLFTLLAGILALTGLMLIVCVVIGCLSSANTFAFMAAECVMLTIRTLHVLIRYGVFLYDMKHGINSLTAFSWDERGRLGYYVDLTFDVTALLIDFMHHIHMLAWGNVLLSMASLLIIMQLRYLVHEIQRKVTKHRNYLWVVHHLEKTYPLASADDISENSDICAICWDKMDIARKLPCSHLFHNSCLQSWLEQDTSCPTCRRALSIQNVTQPRVADIDRAINDDEIPARPNNHFFHFNGSRYVSWLPNFSVEVTHVNNGFRTTNAMQMNNNLGHTSQLQSMAEQIQMMFPHYPVATIIGDLQVTHSMELTIDNMLEGRLPAPPEPAFDDEATNDFDAGAPAVEPSRAFEPSDSEQAHTSRESDQRLFDSSFSTQSSEREQILKIRKDSMVATARKRYIEKNKNELNVNS